ncbi:hypothetical protein TRVL_03667 [Trypanosoma vivax]|nr:hypothetical protein TRVL_03667 [Trypanosoma vivax]
MAETSIAEGHERGHSWRTQAHVGVAQNSSEGVDEARSRGGQKWTVKAHGGRGAEKGENGSDKAGRDQRWANAEAACTQKTEQREERLGHKVEQGPVVQSHRPRGAKGERPRNGQTQRPGRGSVISSTRFCEPCGLAWLARCGQGLVR